MPVSGEIIMETVNATPGCLAGWLAAILYCRGSRKPRLWQGTGHGRPHTAV